MKEAFVHHDLTIVGFKKSILNGARIDCFVRNENTSATLGAGAFGLVQSPVFDAALCIIDDHRSNEAMALLKGEPPVIRGDWCCPKCCESVPGNFPTCWNCCSSPFESA